MSSNDRWSTNQVRRLPACFDSLAELGLTGNALFTLLTSPAFALLTSAAL
jgi:hypothetical protein